MIVNQNWREIISPKHNGPKKIQKPLKLTSFENQSPEPIKINYSLNPSPLRGPIMELKLVKKAESALTGPKTKVRELSNLNSLR